MLKILIKQKSKKKIYQRLKYIKMMVVVNLKGKYLWEIRELRENFSLFRQELL